MTHQVEAFFDPVISTVSYVVYEAAGSACAVIDPVLDFDLRSGRTGCTVAEQLAANVHSAITPASDAWIVNASQPLHQDHARIHVCSPAGIDYLRIRNMPNGYNAAH
jgi:hypothetical protein